MDGTLSGSFTITITGGNLPALLQDLKTWTEVIEAAQAGGTPNGHDDAPAPPQPQPETNPAPAVTTRRRRGREAVASQAAADEIPSRAEIMDLLKKCWGPAPEKVVKIQDQFGVERFAEVPDNQLATLHVAATKLWDELSKAPASAGADAGPFWMNPFWFANPFDDEADE